MKIQILSRTLRDFAKELPDLSSKTVEEGLAADIVLLPELKFRDFPERGFMPETAAIFKYLKLKTDKKIVLLENPNEVKHLALHADEIWFPIFSIGSVTVLPLVINLISQYIYEKFKNRDEKEKPKVHLKIQIENREKRKTAEIDFEGDSGSLEKTLEKIDPKSFWDDK